MRFPKNIPYVSEPDDELARMDWHIIIHVRHPGIPFLLYNSNGLRCMLICMPLLSM
jgi:hypothetical protein